MNPRIVCISALGTMLMSGGASAVGFGDIVLLSRVGEPLRAEVPILTNSGETIESLCFSLAAIRNSDLPVISSARFRLNRNGTTATLSITGTQPIAEPIFVIGLRANCGVDLQRDYVLMPSPPLMLAEAAEPAAAPVAATPAPRRSRNFREWTARRGDTLESIAESQSAGDLAEQQRLLTALKRANPDIVEYEVLAEGRTVRVPNLTRRTAERPVAAQTSAMDRRSNRESPPPRPRKARPAAQPAPAATTGSADRIVLGAAPEDIRPAPRPAPAHASASEVEERMLRLETTLNSLNQEVEKLNAALALATEALAVQQKLMTAQSLQSPAAGSAPTQLVPPPPAPAPSSPNNWLELLLSALVGGGLAAGLAHFFSRRPSHRTDDELAAAAFATPREAIPHSRTPDNAPVALPAAADHGPATPPVSPATVDIPLTPPVADLSADQRTVEVSFNDGNSALELAEIMLSFGRIRGAAETLALHIEENAPDNVQPWTMLLDLYRRGDMRSEFEALAAQMRTRFNIRIPSWEESTTPVSGLKALEDYAHIVWRITNCWGEQECMDYLHDLVHDNRAGNRSGFPLEVVEEIVLLMHVLEEGYGLGGRR